MTAHIVETAKAHLGEGGPHTQKRAMAGALIIALGILAAAPFVALAQAEMMKPKKDSKK